MGLSTLVTIPDLDRLLTHQTRFVEHHPIVEGLIDLGSRAIIKFHEHGFSEVLGYQLAIALGVPVFKHQGFWSREPVETSTRHARAGRIGILIEYMDDLRSVTWEGAVAHDPNATARILALCALDRHEWGQCAIADEHLFFFDLERLLPGIIAELLYAGEVGSDYIDRCVAGYIAQSNDDASEALNEAQYLGVAKATKSCLRDLHSLVNSTKGEHLFALDPHPLEAALVQAALRGLRGRLRTLQNESLLS